MTANCFQERYAPTWAIKGNPREAIAFHELKALFGLGDSDIVLTGKGALSDRHVDDPLESPPDFYVPKLDRFFEVTGSDRTMAYSARRIMADRSITPQLPPIPHIFIRKGKVDAFREQGIARKVLFVHIAEAEGDIRFIPLNELFKRAELVDGYEVGGYDQYYALPWVPSKKPYQLREAYD